MRILLFAGKKSSPNLGAIRIKINNSVAVLLKQTFEPLLVHLRLAMILLPHGLGNTSAYFTDYLNRQEQFGIICLVEEFANAPIAPITLAGLGNNVRIEKICHSNTLPHVEQIVVVKVRHGCKQLFQ